MFFSFFSCYYCFEIFQFFFHFILFCVFIIEEFWNFILGKKLYKLQIVLYLFDCEYTLFLMLNFIVACIMVINGCFWLLFLFYYFWNKISLWKISNKFNKSQKSMHIFISNKWSEKFSLTIIEKYQIMVYNSS